MKINAAIIEREITASSTEISDFRKFILYYVFFHYSIIKILLKVVKTFKII